MSDDKELVPVTVENEVVPMNMHYAGQPIDRDLVVDFADTLMGIHPAAKDVGVIGMRSVAQLALVTGANPMPGTNGIHAWKDNKGKLNIQFGIGFWRGQLEQEGGALWIIKPRPMTKEEQEEHGVKDGQLAAIASAALRKDALSLLAEARSLGLDLTLREAKGEVAQVGTGVVNQNEYAKAGRSPQWTANLRAERDLIRKLVPIMQRARESLISGEYQGGGQDWNVRQYVPSIPSEIPDDYDADDANADLGLEPEITIDEVEELAEELEGEIVMDEDEPGELDSKIADMRSALEELDKTISLQEIANHAMKTGAFVAQKTGRLWDESDYLETMKQWPKWAAAKNPIDTESLKLSRKLWKASALELYDWLVAEVTK